MNDNTSNDKAAGCGNTHTVCNARLEQEEGKDTCCYCDPHSGCTLNSPIPRTGTSGAKESAVLIDLAMRETPELIISTPHTDDGNRSNIPQSGCEDCARNIPHVHSKSSTNNCKNGHPFTPDNLDSHAMKSGWRYCIICRNQTSKKGRRTHDKKMYSDGFTAGKEEGRKDADWMGEMLIDARESGKKTGRAELAREAHQKILSMKDERTEGIYRLVNAHELVRWLQESEVKGL